MTPFATNLRFADWPALIGESVLLRQRLHEVDPDVHGYTIPRQGASGTDLAAAQQRAGLNLDPLHQELLAHAGGWEDFFSYAHLFEPTEFGASDRWRKATELVEVFYAEGPLPSGLPLNSADVYCFCANPDDIDDLFVLWKTGPVTDGGRPVSWLAGEEVQRFPNVHEFMLSVNEYLRRDVSQAGAS